jgi:beta-N-acetylhexosaminidase
MADHLGLVVVADNQRPLKVRYVNEARTRRRRLAAAVTAGLAVAAFAFGAAFGDRAVSPQPSVASRLSLGQLAGERLIAGFTGSEAPDALKRMIRRGQLAGVILFEANLSSRRAARQLTAGIESIPRPAGLRDPLLIMVDQEGGLVKRLSGAPSASAEQMGASGAAFSRRQGRATAGNLANAGINVDLAPVLDVARRGGTIAEAERGFGSTAPRVIAAAMPFARGLQSGGIAATAKHFPGMGSAAENTDFAVQRIELAKRTLRSVDERPYRDYVERGGEIVMLSTAIYPAFSPKPAAFARQIATGELRGRIGFDGVSITDALESVAVRDFGGPAKVTIAGVKAGTDLLLFADYRGAANAHAALVRELHTRALRRPQFEASVGRVLRLRHRLFARAARPR